MKKPGACSCNCQLEGVSACSYFKLLTAEEIPHPFSFDVEPLEVGDFERSILDGAMSRIAYYAFTLAPGESIDVFLSPLRYTVDAPLSEGDRVQVAEITDTSRLELTRHWSPNHTSDVSNYDLLFAARQKTLLPLSGLGHLTPAVPTDLRFVVTRSYAEGLIGLAVFGDSAVQIPTNKLGYFQIRVNGNPVGPLYSEDSFVHAQHLWGLHIPFTSSFFKNRTYDQFQLEYDAGDTIEFDVWPRISLTNTEASSRKYVWSVVLQSVVAIDQPYSLHNIAYYAHSYMHLAHAVYPCANFNFNKDTYRLTSNTGGISQKIVRGLDPQVWELKYLGDEYTGYTFVRTFTYLISGATGSQYGIWVQWGDTVEDILKRPNAIATTSEGIAIDPNVVLFDLQDIEDGIRIVSRDNKNISFTMPESEHFSLTETANFKLLRPTRRTLNCNYDRFGNVITGSDAAYTDTLTIFVSYATTAEELEAAMNPKLHNFSVTEVRYASGVVFTITNLSAVDWSAQAEPGFYGLTLPTAPATITEVSRALCQDRYWFTSAAAKRNIFYMDHYKWVPQPITVGELTVEHHFEFHIPPMENVHIRLFVKLTGPSWMFGFAPTNLAPYSIYFTTYYQPEATGDYVEEATFLDRTLSLGAYGPFNYRDETVFRLTKFTTYADDDGIIGQWYLSYHSWYSIARVFPPVYEEGEVVPAPLLTLVHPVAAEVLNAMEIYRPTSFVVTAVPIEE